MRRERGLARGAAAVAVVLAALAAAMTAAANAGPPPPTNLRVMDGEEAWHPDNRFRLDWTSPTTEGQAPLAAVHYRVLDPLGAVAIFDTRIGWATETIDNLRLPGVRGAYTAEVWLEDAAGNQGPPAAAKLRFDDVRPGHAQPVPNPSWIGRAGFPYTLRLGHPEGEAPISGIRGYAVSIDSASQGDPCAAADRCSDAETDLRGGVHDDALSITGLPEGTSYVHAVAVSGSGMKSATPGHAALHVDTTDPVTKLAGVPGDWTNRAVTLTATATDSGSGMDGAGQGTTPFTAIRADAGAPTVGTGSSARTTVIGEGVHEIAYYARDAVGNVDDGSSSNGVPNASPSTALVRIDRSPPDVSFDNSQNPRDPELIQVKVRDSLSGGDPTRGWIGVRRAGSGDRFDVLPAEPAAAGFQARWDSDAYPAGEYEFRATGYDTAGNAAMTARRSDGARMVLSNPLKTPTTLRAGFGGQRLVRFGRSILFSGDLTAGIRTPLEGMPVRLIERFDPGSDPVERVSTVRTGAGGTFAIHLAPGPSREITAVFGGTRTLTSSHAWPMRLRVRSSLRLRASSGVATIGGRPVIFTGRVAAAGSAIPPEGKSVQLQFRLPGMAWSEFRTIQTDGRGRFRYAYRFSDNDSRGARFQFRAYAPAQSNWPYEPGGSRPVAVRGR